MRVTGEARRAAVQLLSEGQRSNVRQVHEIVLRDVDAMEEAPRVVTLIPLGSVLGIAVHPADRRPADEEILFVSMAALGSTLPALGFTAGAYTLERLVLHAPEDADSGADR